MSDIYLYEPKYNKNADYNVFMAFPECESFSLSSLGYMWLSKILEEQEDFNVERISTDTTKTRISPKEVDAIGFSISFDMDFMNVFFFF